MTDKQLFRLINIDVRRRAANAVMSAPEGHIVRVTPPTRSLEANAALWAMLADVSAQVVWHGRKLDSESWKHVFSSSLQKQDVVPNLDGTGFVVMGISTSKMTKREMSDLLELIQSFGAQQSVKWSY